MGVPAFFKWLSVKYPKIVVDCLEERPTWTDDGARVDVDTSTPNPNGLEFDNLFLDMNGIIHPASHPEDRPPPETEDDMYLAIFDYLERVFAARRTTAPAMLPSLPTALLLRDFCDFLSPPRNICLHLQIFQLLIVNRTIAIAHTEFVIMPCRRNDPLRTLHR